MPFLFYAYYERNSVVSIKKQQMKFSFLPLFLVGILSHFGYAQDKPVTRFYSIGLITGNESNQSVMLNTWHHIIATGNNQFVVPQDMPIHERGNVSYASSASNTIFVDVSSKVKLGSDIQKRWRFGLNYRSMYSVSDASSLLNLSAGTDTFTTATNTTLYVDTTNSRSILSQIEAGFVGLDVSLQLCSRTTKRIQLYGGIGLSVATAIKPTLHTYYETRHSEQIRNSFETFETKNDLVYYHRANFDVASVQSILFCIPFGIELKLSKRNPFWRKMQLFMDVSPGFRMQHFSGINYTAFVYNYRTSFGLRYRLNEIKVVEEPKNVKRA